MNRIFNWTVGSFFRSIGRILAYLVIGGLIFFLLGKSGLISFLHVNASTFANGVEVQYYKEEALTNRWSSNNWYDYASLQSSTSIGSFSQVDFYPSPQINIQDIKKGYIEFTYYMSLPIVRQNVNSTFTLEEEECQRWGKTTINGREVWECILWSSNTNSNTISDSEYIHPVVNINAVIIYNNGYADYCNMDTTNQKFVCPISNYASLTSIKFIRFSQNVYYSNNNQYNFQFGIMRRINRYSDSSQDIINNQNQNHQEMMESNTTQAESEASNFFGNFTTEDHGGINAIITAPLNTIQSLLSNTCTNLVLPLPFVDEDLELPCMNTIYTEHFGLFFQLYQTIILAIISYRCLRSIFYDINGFTNPDDDRIEVMDL